MDIGQIMSIVVSAVGLIGFYFAGKKVWWSWYINLFCQLLWVTFALVTGYLVFLATAAVYSVIFGINAYRWTKEHFHNKKNWKEPELPEPESNLVLHARSELKRIGEEPEVIEWYAKVIREYSSFGHSGGSHMAILPVLTKLLNFEPIGPLTDDPQEWYHHGMDVWGEEGGVWQNKRDGRMFSKDGGKTYTNVEDRKDDEGDQPVYYSEVVNADVQK